MKKILFVMLLALAGCSSKKITKMESDYPSDGVVEFTYKDHSYIGFSRLYGLGVVHDPDCSCFKK